MMERGIERNEWFVLWNKGGNIGCVRYECGGKDKERQCCHCGGTILNLKVGQNNR